MTEEVGTSWRSGETTYFAPTVRTRDPFSSLTTFLQSKCDAASIHSPDASTSKDGRRFDFRRASRVGRHLDPNRRQDATRVESMSSCESRVQLPQRWLSGGTLPGHLSYVLRYTAYFAHSHLLYDFIRRDDFEAVSRLVQYTLIRWIRYDHHRGSSRSGWFLAIGSTSHCSVSLVDETEGMQVG